MSLDPADGWLAGPVCRAVPCTLTRGYRQPSLSLSLPLLSPLSSSSAAVVSCALRWPPQTRSVLSSHLTSTSPSCQRQREPLHRFRSSQLSTLSGARRRRSFDYFRTPRLDSTDRIFRIRAHQRAASTSLALPRLRLAHLSDPTLLHRFVRAIRPDSTHHSFDIDGPSDNGPGTIVQAYFCHCGPSESRL